MPKKSCPFLNSGYKKGPDSLSIGLHIVYPIYFITNREGRGWPVGRKLGLGKNKLKGVRKSEKNYHKNGGKA